MSETPAVGARVLVQIRRKAASGAVLFTRRLDGEVVAVTPMTVYLRLSDGRDLHLPPGPAGYQKAKPGAYEVDDGSSLVDADLVSAWVDIEGTGLFPDDRFPLPRRAPRHLRGVNTTSGTSFDPRRAKAFEGKSILIEVTYVDDGEPVGERQFHGRITSFSETNVRVSLHGGGVLDLPPDVRAFHWARPGEYKLPSTGEVIEDPDVYTHWTSTGTPFGAGVLTRVDCG